MEAPDNFIIQSKNRKTKVNCQSKSQEDQNDYNIIQSRKNGVIGQIIKWRLNIEAYQSDLPLPVAMTTKQSFPSKIFSIISFW